MNDQNADWGLSDLPIHHPPPIRPLDRVLTTSPPTQWMIDTITNQWRKRGFVVAPPSEKYDPLLGYVTEWYGYEKETT